jgi:uncharacterized membrane protein YvlD (DUF360 family)
MNLSSLPLNNLNNIAAFDPYFWLIQTIAMALTALLIPNLRITSILGPVLAVLALSTINCTIWSQSLFSTLPATFSEHTLTLLAINGAIFWIVVKLVPGIESKGILPVLIAPIVFTTCSVALPKIFSAVDWKVVRIEAARVLDQTKRFVGEGDSGEK